MTDIRKIETDIVIVGAGASGLCAAVQAGANGNRVTVIEVNNHIGGNGLMTEGIFAAGSKMQKEAGIEITFKELFAKEASFFNYRINSLLWKDLYHHSAENIDWLIENGVEFSGVVDEYAGFGHVPGFHWFAHKRGKQFVTALYEKAVKQGAEFLLETRGTELIMEKGCVAGIYATTKEHESLEIRCKAVILASGGYAGNRKMMAERGKNPKRIEYAGGPGHDGDGLNMAVRAGALDISHKTCYLCGMGTQGLAPLGDTVLRFLTCESPAIWVNQDALRFAREDCALETSGCQVNACETQKETYAIIDCNGLDAIEKNTLGLKTTILNDVEHYIRTGKGGDIAVCDTIKDCAHAMNLDPATLKETLDTYNGYCKAGDGLDFGKSLKYMVPLTKAPYYIFRHNIAYMCSMGGIHTNIKTEALTKDDTVIPGLYAVGTDGCELYRETYTISVPASINAYNCHSGRVAANNAAAYITDK